jgi:hypothetical protein
VGEDEEKVALDREENLSISGFTKLARAKAIDKHKTEPVGTRGEGRGISSVRIP